MSESDRKRMGVSTSEEREANQVVKLEKELHDGFKQWLRLNSIPYIYGGGGRRSTMTPGWPDFTCLRMGRAVCIEFKVKGNKPQPIQLSCMQQLDSAGVIYLISYTLEDAIAFARQHLAL